MTTRISKGSQTLNHKHYVKKLLIALKDMAATNGLIPVIKNLPSHITPLICAEGLAMERLDAANIRIDFRGTKNFEHEPFEFNPARLIAEQRPHATLVGLGSPNNIEGRIALAASQAKIPVLMYEDFWWTAAKRGGAIPNVVFVIDECAGELALKSFPLAHIVVVGDPAALPPTEEIPEELERLSSRFTCVITYFGGGPEATHAELKLLVASLKKTSGNWCLIPRLHPKWADIPSKPSGPTWGKVWDNILKPLGKRVVRSNVASSELVVMGSNVVVGSFSKLLTTAAVAHKAVVALVTMEGMASLRAQSLLKEFPHVSLGIAHEISAPYDLAKFLPILPVITHARCKPYQPQLVVQTLSELLK